MISKHNARRKTTLVALTIAEHKLSEYEMGKLPRRDKSTPVYMTVEDAIAHQRQIVETLRAKLEAA